MSSPAGRTRTAPAARLAGADDDVLRVVLALRAGLVHRATAGSPRSSRISFCTLAITSTSMRPDRRAMCVVTSAAETVTLADYRQRYAQYKTDPDLQAAHAAAPWLVVFDDHEFADNWADEVPAGTATGLPASAVPRRCGPTTRTCRCADASMPTASTCGCTGACAGATLATFHMLDTRQYRDDQACGDEFGRLRRAFRSRAHDDGSGAGTLAAQRVCAVARPLGRTGTAGVLLAGRPDTWARTRRQPRRLGRLHGQPRPRRRRPRRLACAQRRRPHRRHPLALGGRGARDVRRPDITGGGNGIGDDIDQFRRRRVRYA